MNRVWIAVAAAVPLFATDAIAATRYDISNMACSEVQALVKREGEAVLAYRSSSILGLPIYDRYVKDRQYCASSEVIGGQASRPRTKSTAR